MTHWLIRDGTGVPQALKVRYWDTRTSKKTDRWATAQPDFVDIDGAIDWGLKGRSQKTLPLYGAERLGNKPDACRTVFITEGAADADALAPIAAKHDAIVLAVMTGAPVVPDVEVFKDLAMAVAENEIDEVLLWPDKDDSGVGQRFMGHVGKQIVKAGGPPVRIIDWEVPAQIAEDAKGPGGADWAKAGQKPSLPDLIDAAEPWEPPRPGRPPKNGVRAFARRGGGSSKSSKSSSPTIEELAAGRVPVEVVSGHRGSWMMDTVDALVKVGFHDDRQSLYENTVTTSGKKMPWCRLVIKPPGEVFRGVRLKDEALLIEWADPDSIAAQVDRQVCLYRSASDRKPSPVELSRSNVGIMTSHYSMRQVDAKDNGPRFRPLVGIADAPTISSEGSLIRKGGYDTTSGLYANFRTKDWEGLIPDRFDERAAFEAVDLLYDLVAETLWKEENKEVYKAVWLASLLTVAARNYVRGNVPLTLISGNDSGCGKGTLCDTISAITLGRTATKLPPVGGRDKDAEAEERKRMTAVAMLGERMIVIDNVPAGTPYGNATIDMALTAGSDDTIGTYSDRVLSSNLIVSVPFRVVPFVTGNGPGGGRGSCATRDTDTALQ